MRLAAFLFLATLFADTPARYELITSGEGLYWTAREDGMAFAQGGVTPASTDVPKRKDTQFVQGEWNGGFRFGLGISLEHEAWTAFFQYTRFTLDNYATYNEPFAPTWNIAGIMGVQEGNLNVGLQGNTASSTWNLLYNNFMLELGKKYGYFTPHIGMTAAWHKQTYDVNYENFTNLSAYEKLSTAMHNNTWGIGIRVGIHSAWMFNKTWGFYGDGAISALWTRFQLLRKDTATEPNGTAIVPVNNSSDFHTVKPFLDLGLGLRFLYVTSKETATLQGKIGWEEQVWWNENQLTELYSATGNHGDLILQGLTASLRIDY